MDLQSVVPVWLFRCKSSLNVELRSLTMFSYISELSPSIFRGRLVTLTILFVTIGQMAAYFVGWKLSSAVYGWRWMVGLGSVPAIIQSGLILLLPETPRWLMKVGQINMARKVLRKVYGAGSNAIVEGLLRAIEGEVLEEEESISMLNTMNLSPKWDASWPQKLRDNWRRLFLNGGNRRALTIACLLQGLQQLCGFVRISFYYYSEIKADLLEFSHVFLSNNLRPCWLRLANFSFSLRSRDELRLHCGGDITD